MAPDSVLRRRAHAAAADLLCGQGEPAARHLRALLDLTEAGPDIEILARRLEREGDIEGALDSWRRLLAAAPQSAALHEELARLLSILARPGEAVVHLRWLAEADSAEPRGWRRVARAQAQLQDSAAEAAALAELLRLQPTDLGAQERIVGLLEALGRHAETPAHLRVLAEATADDPAGWRRLASAQATAGDNLGRTQSLLRVVALRPDDIGARQALIALLEGGGDALSAVPHRWAVAEAAGDRGKTWRGLAAHLAGVGDTAGELSALRRAVALDPEDWGSHSLLADRLAALGESILAIGHLRILAEVEPAKVKPWRRLIAAQAASGDAVGEAQSWARLLATTPADLGGHRRRAELLEALGRAAEAVPHRQALAEADPTNLKAWRALVADQAAAGDAAGEAASWAHLLAAAPGDLIGHRRRAALLETLGRGAETSPHLWALARSDPQPRSWRTLAKQLSALGDATGEAEAWTEVLAADSRDLQALGRLVDLDEARGAIDQAAERLEALTALQPGKIKSWRRLAALRAAQGDAAGEIRALAGALALTPDDLALHRRRLDLLTAGDDAGQAEHLWALAEAEALRPKTWVRLAQRLAAIGDHRGEAAALVRLLAIEPNDLAAHDRLASLFEAEGEFATAAQHLRPVIEARPDWVKGWRRLADLLDLAGDSAGEIEAWARILAIRPGDVAAHNRTIALLRSLGRQGETPQHLWIVAEAAGDRLKVWRALAADLATAGDLDGEVAAWQRAVAVDPKDLLSHRRLAELHESRQDWAEAAGSLRVLAELHPDQPALWNRIAIALRQAGDIDGETKALERAAPGADRDARLAQLYWQAGRQAEALPYLDGERAPDRPAP